MKLYIMKRDALDLLKDNLSDIYGRYYTEKTNKWIEEICGENPFVEFKDVPEFSLANLDSDLTPGEIDLENCKILYDKLRFLSESQASDERLWAGLAHSTFYEYMRKRWGYGYGKKPKSAEKEAGAIKSRFFYGGAGRSGFYRNTLAKSWWVGHNTYDPKCKENHYEKLDIIGSNDLSTKVNEFFYNFTFSSNPDVLQAIVDGLRRFKDEGKQLSVRYHIRPALSYLNAVGGSIVIDCLAKEDITDIFCDAIDAIMQGDKPSLNLDKTDTLDESEDMENESVEDDKAEVTLGSKITIRNDSGKRRMFQYEFHFGKLPDSLSVFDGRKTGDLIELDNEQWIIEEILF